MASDQGNQDSKPSSVTTPVLALEIPQKPTSQQTKRQSIPHAQLQQAWPSAFKNGVLPVRRPQDPDSKPSPNKDSTGSQGSSPESRSPREKDYNAHMERWRKEKYRMKRGRRLRVSRSEIGLHRTLDDVDAELLTTSHDPDHAARLLEEQDWKRQTDDESDEMVAKGEREGVRRRKCVEKRHGRSKT